MTIVEIQNKIVEEFSPFTESIDKYKHLIKLAKSLPPLDQQFKTSENTIKGCQSTVWLAVKINNDRMNLQGDTDVMITKGILSLLLRVYNNQKLSDVAETEPIFLEKIGLKQSLSPQRANGVKAIVEHIRKTARENLL